MFHLPIHQDTRSCLMMSIFPSHRIRLTQYTTPHSPHHGVQPRTAHTFRQQRLSNTGSCHLIDNDRLKSTHKCPHNLHQLAPLRILDNVHPQIEVDRYIWPRLTRRAGRDRCNPQQNYSVRHNWFLSFRQRTHHTWSLSNHTHIHRPRRTLPRPHSDHALNTYPQCKKYYRMVHGHHDHKGCKCHLRTLVRCRRTCRRRHIFHVQSILCWICIRHRSRVLLYHLRTLRILLPPNPHDTCSHHFHCSVLALSRNRNGRN